jgi:hypothetical protein
MDRITLAELKETFLETRFPWCVSIYMPTHRAGRETEQDRIRFKNLLREVENRFLAQGLRSPEVRERLKDAYQLLQDGGFWKRRSDGLAVFFSAGGLRALRLPVHFEETLVISDRCHVKPLLPLLVSDSRFFILALSQNQVRLLEAPATRPSMSNWRDCPTAWPNRWPTPLRNGSFNSTPARRRWADKGPPCFSATTSARRTRTSCCGGSG